MLCKNCNYILTGKENFCPNCAAPLGEKFTVMKKAEAENTSAEAEASPVSPSERKEYIFPGKENEGPSAKDVRIFYDAPERDDDKKDEKPKSYAGKILLLLFLTCFFAVSAFAVADYFDVTSTVVSLLEAASRDKEDTTENTYNHESSIIKPDISYTAVTAYVTSGSGLSLRKGPGKNYAPVETLADLTRVEIYGSSASDSQWVYVYCGEKQCYGWLDGSFLSKNQESTTLALSNNSSSVNHTAGVSE